MKRALLIAGGTLGGLGAVMAITPPQFSSTDSLAIGGGAMSAPTPTAVASTSSTPEATKSATSAPTKTSTTKKATPAKSVAASSNSNSATPTADPTPAQTNTATPTPVATKTTAAPAPKGVTGTFAGPAIFVNYGTVQVQITVKNGKITDATALQAPSGRNDRWTNMALPILKQQTLAAQSDAIQGASGASYTSYGWYKSLQGALAKAGL